MIHSSLRVTCIYFILHLFDTVYFTMFDMLDLIFLHLFFYNSCSSIFQGIFRGIFKLIKGYFRPSNRASVGEGLGVQFLELWHFLDAEVEIFRNEGGCSLADAG